MMKTNKLIYLLTLFVFAFSTVACTEQLEEINRNPNATEKPVPAYLLSATQYKSANLYWGSAASYNATLLWVQHWAKIQYTEPDCYNVNTSSFTNTWDVAYATVLANLTAIKESELGNDNYTGVAMIWQSWCYLQLTSLYGEIPYTQYGLSITPTYDTQEVILLGLLSDLEAAYQLLSVSGPAISGDLIYNNDIGRWKKLAQSLRLRIALLLADRDEATASKLIAELYSQRGNLLNQPEDVAQFIFAASPQWNPWASAFSARDDQRLSKTLVDKLNEWNDPRIAVYAQLPQDVSVNYYQGAANGLSADAANNQGFYKLSRPGLFFLADNSPAVFFTYAEVLFIYAEAAARGWIQADAATLYADAITASLLQFGATTLQIKSYLEQDEIRYNSEHWYECIGWQKWIAYYGQGIDAFTDWRRLGYPLLTPGPNSALELGELPRRFFYPNTEQSLNGISYREAVSRQGADELTTRLWFDVFPKKR